MSENCSIFIHAANIEGIQDRLQRHIRLIEITGLLAIVKSVYICYVGDKDLQFTHTNSKIILQHVSNDLNAYEVPTQQALWKYACENPTSKLLYLHTKGVGKERNQCIEDWIQYMTYFSVEQWRDALTKLDTYDTTGVDLLHEPTLHYSGNFWWAKASYLSTLPSPIEFADLQRYPNPLGSERHNQEFWICYNKGNHYCFWQSEINCYHRHINLYPREKYAAVDTTKKICIFFLTGNNRSYVLPQFVHNITSSKYKHMIKLLILTNPDDDLTKYTNQFEGKDMDTTMIVLSTDNNYMRKVDCAIEFAELYHLPYLMKHDNDLLCSPYLYDFLFENLQLLDDPKNLVLTPTLTSGIPTVEQFIQDFLTKEEQMIMYTLFLQHRFGPLWGADFTPLNQHTVDAQYWNPYEFFKGVKNIPHHYLGVHPVRLYDKAIFVLNEFVLRHKKELFEKRDFKFVYDNFCPYFCNSIYLIKRDIYKTINTSPELSVDAFDEVPLNKYRDKHNLNIVYTQNGAAVHIIYNCIPHHELYERLFMNKFNEL